MALWQSAGLTCPLGCQRRSSTPGTSPGDIPAPTNTLKSRSSQVLLFEWNNSKRTPKGRVIFKYILQPQLRHSAQRQWNKKCNTKFSPPTVSKLTQFLLTMYRQLTQDCCTSNRDARDLHRETCKEARWLCRSRVGWMKEIQLLPWQPLASHLSHHWSCSVLFPSNARSWFQSKGVFLLGMIRRKCVFKREGIFSQHRMGRGGLGEGRITWEWVRTDHEEWRWMGRKEAFKGRNRISLVETPDRDRGVLLT